MRMTRAEFLAWPQKAVTLLGMSGVGKTFLANKLPKTHWFHYSGDYRLGTKYLAEPILDNIKRQAMQVEALGARALHSARYPKTRCSESSRISARSSAFSDTGC